MPENELSIWADKPTDQSLALEETFEHDDGGNADPFAVGERAIVKRSNGAMETTWSVVEHTPEGYIVVRKNNAQPGELDTKTFTRERMEQFKEAFDDKLALDLGESAVEATGIEAPEPTELEKAEAELAAFLDTLNPGDRTGVWAYAVAKSDHEREFALENRLSPGARAHGYHLQYEQLFNRLRELRQ